MIKQVVDRLVKTYDPIEIYLFGSYAWGHPDEESDLDLLIVVEKSESPSFKRPIKGHKALLDFMISKDILVYTKDEFKKFSSDITRFSYKIKNKGKRVYGKA